MHPVTYYALLIVLGVIPSLIWLFYYLRKDCHPEPKYLVTKTFLMGIIISPIAIILQLWFASAMSALFPGSPPRGAAFFLWAALVEELVKFYAVREVALRDPEFDEPVDAMIYMITAALGFAAMENILVMFQVLPDGANAAFSVWTLRFLGATLLHTLSSAIVGYFLALSWFFQHHAKKLVVIGIIIATLFHFTFNVFLALFQDQLLSLGYTTSLLIIMAFLVSVLFDRIKKRSNIGIALAATQDK